MYDKYWELVSKTKKIAVVYIIITIIASLIVKWFTIQAAPGVALSMEDIKAKLPQIVESLVLIAVYLPVTGFVLEHLFDSEKKDVMYYLKGWFLQDLLFTLLVSVIVVGLLVIGVKTQHIFIALLLCAIAGIIYIKFVFYIKMAIHENISVFRSLEESWKRVGFGRAIKAWLYTLLSILPFLIVGSIITAVATHAFGYGSPDASQGITLAITFITETIQSIGAWFAALVIYVHYWQLLIDEGNIATPVNNQNPIGKPVE